jgi:hypothetical protein
MSAGHNRLDALRRVAKDRAATPAEKATARRLDKALAAKVGKRPGRSRRRGLSAALPEPPAARWRRQRIAWLEAVLDKFAVAGSWVHVIWIASLIGLVLMLVFGTEAVRRQAGSSFCAFCAPPRLEAAPISLLYRSVGSGLTCTSILPKLSPRSISAKAVGMVSRPWRMSSRYLILPAAIRGVT